MDSAIRARLDCGERSILPSALTLTVFDPFRAGRGSTICARPAFGIRLAEPEDRSAGRIFLGLRRGPLGRLDPLTESGVYQVVTDAVFPIPKRSTSPSRTRG